MTEHYIKITPHFLERIEDWQKTFEVRKNDRDYQTGDRIILQPFNQLTQQYTGGNEVACKIVYIHTGLWMIEWYCVLWIELEEDEEPVNDVKK